MKNRTGPRNGQVPQRYIESMPITLRFASDVGDILRELPEEIEPRPEYRYYV